MAGEPWIDSLARALTDDLSRRAVLRRLGAAAGMLLGAGAATPARRAEAATWFGQVADCRRTATCGDGDESVGEPQGDEPHGPCARDTADACGVLCGEEDVTRLTCSDVAGAPRVWIDCVGSEALIARCDLDDTVSALTDPLQSLHKLRAASTTTPVPPAGLRELLTAQIQLQPLATPNSVTLTLFYPDTDLLGVSETTLRAFYFVDELSVWVELVATVDPPLNAVRVHNVDVSAFANRLRWISIFA